MKVFAALTFRASGARFDLVIRTSSSSIVRWLTLLRLPFGRPAGLPDWPFLKRLCGGWTEALKRTAGREFALISNPMTSRSTRIRRKGGPPPKRTTTAGPARKRGRPTKYQPEFAEQAKALCEDGAIDVDLADFFGVAIRTISYWKTAHADFLHALKAGKSVADERVERALYQRAVGYTFDAVKIFLPKDAVEPVLVPYREHCPPDVTACIFWLKNRKKDEWRDKQLHEHTGKDSGPIETRQYTDIEAARLIAP